MDRKHNYNEAITLPAPGLPVLLPASSAEKADGRVVGYKVGTVALEQPVDLPVRVVPGDALYQVCSADERDRRKFSDEYGEVADLWRPVLVDVARAAHEMTHGSRAEAQRIIREHLKDESDFKRLASANPADWLVRMLSDGLRKPQGAVQFVLWWNDKASCLSRGLLCPDARTAAFALLLGTVGQPSGLGVCSRCGNPFQARRGQQRYCSSRCQTAAAMARYRVNLKQRKRKRGSTRPGDSRRKGKS